MTFEAGHFDSAEMDAVVTSRNLINQSELSAKERLVVAVDKPTVLEARHFVNLLNETAAVFKIGLELVCAGGGIEFARELKDEGKQVFLDMKLWDIPNTIKKSVQSVARNGFHFLTVHAIDRKTLDAAVEGRDSLSSGHQLKLLGVTVLTSYLRSDLLEQGIQYDTECLDISIQRAVMAKQAGFQGVIASAHEAGAIRRVINDDDFIIKVPGIRPHGSQQFGFDQERVMTPAQAIKEGATYVVVGRPISDAQDPKHAAESIIKEIASAL